MTETLRSRRRGPAVSVPRGSRRPAASVHYWVKLCAWCEGIIRQGSRGRGHGPYCSSACRLRAWREAKRGDRNVSVDPAQ